jgi:hypothetical protein
VLADLRWRRVCWRRSLPATCGSGSVHSPLQITDYYRGYARFRRLYANKPAGQTTREWVDAVLRAGPLPITSLGFLFDGAL